MPKRPCRNQNCHLQSIGCEPMRSTETTSTELWSSCSMQWMLTKFLLANEEHQPSTFAAQPCPLFGPMPCRSAALRVERTQSCMLSPGSPESWLGRSGHDEICKARAISLCWTWCTIAVHQLAEFLTIFDSVYARRARNRALDTQ